LDESNVRGYKNPYHDDYRRIPERLNPYEWIAERFAALAADRKQHILAVKLREVETRIAEERSRREYHERSSELARTARRAALPSDHDGDEPKPPPTPPAAPTAPSAAPAPNATPRPAPPTAPTQQAPAWQQRQRQAPPPP